jgi:tRNA-dihydrouridine synthase
MAHHGEAMGVRTARKRVSFLFSGVVGGAIWCERFMSLDTAAQQHQALNDFLDESAARHPFFQYSQDPSKQADVHG